MLQSLASFAQSSWHLSSVYRSLSASLLLTHSSSFQLHTSVYPSLTEARFFHHSIPPLPSLLKPIAEELARKDLSYIVTDLHLYNEAITGRAWAWAITRCLQNSVTTYCSQTTCSFFRCRLQGWRHYVPSCLGGWDCYGSLSNFDSLQTNS